MKNKKGHGSLLKASILSLVITAVSCTPPQDKPGKAQTREKISINNNWSFFKYSSAQEADSLIYDVRPEVKDKNDNKEADSKPTEAVEVEENQFVLKPWILPTGNEFIKDPSKRYQRPEGNPGSNFPFVQQDFDDNNWEKVNLPHDWAIKGPFLEGWGAEVGGGMGRLASHGVAWYRRKIDISKADADKSTFLDIDGAMSYAMVWCNGKLVGGWPYGYNSWRVDLTPYVVPGGTNQLAIRIDNPPLSSRWYPGGGLYRNVWITKTGKVHVAHWGTYLTTPKVSEQSATVNLEVQVDNQADKELNIEIKTDIYKLAPSGEISGDVVASFPSQNTQIAAGKSSKVKTTVTLDQPDLWGPPPTQEPNLYMAVTTLLKDGKPIDAYKTRFGIRNIEYNPNKGLIVNGEHIAIKGVNQHHDLGALGAAFNTRAAERQLEILKEMGCNAVRMAHNPPAPELLELTDRMGFLVVDEVFDVWERKKTPLDFHLIFPEWHEQDLRALLRRDRNCPSIIIWSFGNEVGEQYTGKAGAAIANNLRKIVREEDPTRPTTSAMNFAKPDMELPPALDIISLNYQGEGIRQDPEFEGTDRIRTKPQYDAYHAKFPEKMILSSETAAAFSSRGIYYFPVSKQLSAPVSDGRGGNSETRQVTSYELHAVDFGCTADKVFGSIESHPFVAGEFVWTGWDHLGEPTPYYLSRSAYCGMIDIAGFKKDRYYLYQSHWRPDFPMAHILPHWNWPDRVGKITPVHVFTSGDEAELFLNGKSLGRKKKAKYQYRLRWDDVKYQPGELKVIAYKNGKKWAEDVVKTTGEPAQLKAEADRTTLQADGKDLAFITVKICDSEGLFVTNSTNTIDFSMEGPGEIVATDNGDATDMEIFSSHSRKAFSGMALVIVKAKEGQSGPIKLKGTSKGLQEFEINLQAQK